MNNETGNGKKGLFSRLTERKTRKVQVAAILNWKRFQKNMIQKKKKRYALAIVLTVVGQ